MENSKSQYIIGIHQYDDVEKRWEFQDEGFAVIRDRSYGPTLTIANKEDLNDPAIKYYLDVIISKDFNCDYKNSENGSGYTARFTNDNFKIGIKFDEASSQAFEDFKNEIQKRIDSEFKSIYYDSGNLRYSGQFVNNDVTGDGTEFYDTPEQKIKYKGEFEDNYYDGAGTFYSYDNSLEIVCNNISSGVPNGILTLSIHRKNKDDIKKTFKLKDIGESINVGDTNFCEKVARHLYKDLDKLLFEAFTIEEKMDELNNKMNMILKDFQREKEIKENRNIFQKILEVVL